MYKIGLHAGYWGESEIDGNFDAMIALYPKLGLDILEMSAFPLLHYTKDALADFKKRLDDSGLGIVFNGGNNPNLDLAHEDPVVRDAAIEQSKRAMDVAASVGGRVYSGVNYSLWKRLPAGPLTVDEKRRILSYSLDAIKKLMPTAENLGIAYAFEIVNRFEQFLLNTTDEGLAFCEAVGSPSAQLQLDIFHMNIDELNLFDALEKATKLGKMAHLHVGEPDRSVPGLKKSHLDWQRVFDTIRSAGYQGAVTIEPFTRMYGQRNYNACVWRNLGPNDMESRCAEIRASVAFLKSL
nr:sugar phosphate isomerase/epimerase family protein [Maliibacterium massiliense]